MIAMFRGQEIIGGENIQGKQTAIST